MTDIALRCTGLTKCFGCVRAVDKLELTVQKGEILALLGPSGCGKTTALRLIAGFQDPDEGKVEISSVPVATASLALPPEQRRVGMVFQDYALFPHLTVGENIAYGLGRGKNRAGRVRDVLELVGMAGLEARMPHELSGGQQQRVALARALAPDPDILLLDEPFSNLDAGQRVRVREQVRDILKRSGCTAIFVTHDQEEALYMGDRLGIINEGRVEQIGAPEEVFQRPKTRFVASFLGLTDFLPGEITPAGIRTELGTLPCEDELEPGTRVEVVVRPDDVAIHPDEKSSARIEERLYQGMTNVYRVRLPSGQTIHSLQPHFVRYERGAAVRVAIDAGHTLAYVFPNGSAMG